MISMLTRVSLPLLAMTVLWSGAANAQFSDSVASFKIWHNPNLAKSGKVLAELSFKTPPRVNPVLNVNGANLTFSDSGTNGDIKKGDGIFSATPTMKITSFMAEQVNNTKKPLGLEEIVKVSVNSPMFEGRAVVRDDEQVKHLMSIIDDPKINKTVSQLRELSTVLPKMADQDLFSKLSIDAKITPAIEVIPRPNKDSLVRFIGIPAEVFSGQLSTGINPANSLMITHPTVIKDPTRTFNFCTNTGNRDGVWTFSYVMTKLAAGSGLTPEQYTLNWLNKWTTNQTLLNGDVAPARPNISQVISRWEANSPGGVKNIRYFPAELMAIVNRPDIGISLSGAGGYGNNDLSRGETRFVFALLDKQTNGDTYPTGKLDGKIVKPPVSKCTTMPFTVIFEYNNAATACSSIKNWQTQWKNLGSLSLGSGAYNTALANLTTPIVNNKNLLAHLRTNERALASPWELREFRLGSNGHLIHLKQPQKQV